jgi:hypothetical protein
LDAELGEHDGLGKRNAFVGRLSRKVFEQSSLGALATLGNPNSVNNNAVFGPDFNFRTSRFLGSRMLEANLFALGTYTEHQSNQLGYTYGATVAYPNDLLAARFDCIQIAEAFHPAMGYVQQTGVRGYAAELGYYPRPNLRQAVRHLSFETRSVLFTDLDNSLDHAAFRLTPLGVHFESDDELFIALERQFDRPRSAARAGTTCGWNRVKKRRSTA